MKIGDKVDIESRKFRNRFHRMWENSVILKWGEPLIVANFHSSVIEPGGKNWHFQGLAICLFSKHNWFNVIMVYHPPSSHPYYYCNIASPYCFYAQQNKVQYVDFDIDVTVDPERNIIRLLDWDEWMANRIRYAYPYPIIRRVEEAINQLRKWIYLRKEPFSLSFSEYWYHQYFLLSQ